VNIYTGEMRLQETGGSEDSRGTDRPNGTLVPIFLSASFPSTRSSFFTLFRESFLSFPLFHSIMAEYIVACAVRASPLQKNGERNSPKSRASSQIFFKDHLPGRCSSMPLDPPCDFYIQGVEFFQWLHVEIIDIKETEREKHSYGEFHISFKLLFTVLIAFAEKKDEIKSPAVYESSR